MAQHPNEVFENVIFVVLFQCRWNEEPSIELGKTRKDLGNLKAYTEASSMNSSYCYLLMTGAKLINEYAHKTQFQFSFTRKRKN